MTSRMTSTLACAVAAVLAACAPRMGNVIPTEGGNYHAVATGESKDEALRSALHSAEQTCKSRQMRHIVLDRTTEYNGVVSEDTNRAINQAQEIMVVTSGEVLPTLSRDDDYRVTLHFKCER